MQRGAGIRPMGHPTGQRGPRPILPRPVCPRDQPQKYRSRSARLVCLSIRVTRLKTSEDIRHHPFQWNMSLTLKLHMPHLVRRLTVYRDDFCRRNGLQTFFFHDSKSRLYRAQGLFFFEVVLLCIRSKLGRSGCDGWRRPLCSAVHIAWISPTYVHRHGKNHFVVFFHVYGTSFQN